MSSTTATTWTFLGLPVSQHNQGAACALKLRRKRRVVVVRLAAQIIGWGWVCWNVLAILWNVPHELASGYSVYKVFAEVAVTAVLASPGVLLIMWGRKRQGPGPP